MSVLRVAGVLCVCTDGGGCPVSVLTVAGGLCVCTDGGGWPLCLY